MNAKKLDYYYQQKKNLFHGYILAIKSSMPVDIYSISNITLIKNPYSSVFPFSFFSQKTIIKNKILLFFKSTMVFYLKQLYFFISYIITFFLFTVYFRPQRKLSKRDCLIDVFLLSNTIIKENTFNERYFDSLYTVLEKINIPYSIVPRIYSTSKNPFKLISFFKLLSKDKRDFLFEFELLHWYDFIQIFWMILIYPFKTLRLLQEEKTEQDKIFNQALLQDISTQGMNTFSRYVFGKNIAKLKTVKYIYSWSEFQVIERSFNYGISKINSKIKSVGCQFYLNYETYFNAYVDDIDAEHGTAYKQVLVNGKVYILDRKNVKYEAGVSLRYKNVFTYVPKNEGNDVLILGSYIVSDTQYMLQSVGNFEKVFFKKHPAVSIDKFYPLPENVALVEDDIYTLFKNIDLVIGTASGTTVEAVACGKSVIVMASQDNLTANPLMKYGQGKIWEIAFSKDDVEKHYNKLIKYREENPQKINEIAQWYKDNFFVEPTEENIIKAFELGE